MHKCLSLIIIFSLTACGGGGSVPELVYLTPVYGDDYSEVIILEGNKEIVNIIAIDSNNRNVLHSIDKVMNFKVYDF